MANLDGRQLVDETRGISIGVDLGKLQDHTAIVIAEGQVRSGSEEHVVIRSIERKRLGTDYKAIARRLADINEKLACLASEDNSRRKAHRVLGGSLPPVKGPTFYIDVTGLGGPFCDFLMGESPELKVVAVSITAGDRVSEWNSRGKYSVIHVGKSALVHRLQLLLGTERIHLADTPEAKLLVEELKVFQVSVNESTSHGSYGAVSGAHDDLVIAAALAAWQRVSNRSFHGSVSYI
ncbi:hypothetical protein ACFLSW_00830 [Candidatus Bipolaricaulota bacterium]